MKPSRIQELVEEELLKQEIEARSRDEEFKLLTNLEYICRRGVQKPPQGLLRKKCPACSSRLGKRRIYHKSESIRHYICPGCDYEWADNLKFEVSYC